MSLVVGPVLTLINQFHALTEPATLNPWKAALTFLVPYCVATVSAVLAGNARSHNTECTGTDSV